MARPTKYPFSDLLPGVGDTTQFLAATKTDVQRIRNAATQWALKTGAKVVTRTMKVDDGIVVTVERIDAGPN